MSPPPKVVAADYSGRATACLASDTATAGASNEVQQVWSAMQHASAGKNVQQLIQPVSNADQALPYLGSLISQHCDLIVTIGPAFGQAVPTTAKAVPTARFTAVDSTLTSTPPGVTLLTGAQASDQVPQQIEALQRDTGTHS
ncbi:hypothetical protein [Kitasatospora sp. LaBMicrA B282]|uniref:hypothetical protein n=1 Tax=Kitasatospora sp. LaBMicrA B282 TaxID=3420949 RepID=UPI003D0F1EDA